MFTAALFTIAKMWKQSKWPPADERLEKMWCVCAMEYYAAIKIAICSNPNRSRDDHTEWSHRKKDAYHDLVYIWNINCNTGEPICETETESRTQRTDQWLPWGSVGAVMDWECGVRRRKLLHREWTSSKARVHSTGNHVQYPVINCNVNICTWVTVIQQKLTQYYNSTILY